MKEITDLMEILLNFLNIWLLHAPYKSYLGLNLL